MPPEDPIFILPVNHGCSIHVRFTHTDNAVECSIQKNLYERRNDFDSPKVQLFFFFNVAIIGAKSCQDHTCQTQLEAHIPVQSQINYKFHMQTKI